MAAVARVAGNSDRPSRAAPRKQAWALVAWYLLPPMAKDDEGGMLNPDKAWDKGDDVILLIAAWIVLEDCAPRGKAKLATGMQRRAIARRLRNVLFLQHRENEDVPEEVRTLIDQVLSCTAVYEDTKA